MLVLIKEEDDDDIMMTFAFTIGELVFGFVFGVEFWKRKSILGYGNGFKDGLEEGLMYVKTEGE